MKKGIVAYISKETDFFSYIDKLAHHLSELKIVITSKDNIGYSLPPEISTKWKSLNLETDLYPKGFIQTPWRSYIAVIDRGKPVFEKLGDIDGSDCYYEDELFKIKSTVFKGGSVEPTHIIYNDTNYSIDLRGLNFLVIDSNDNSVIDFVNFDAFEPEICCRRIDANLISLSVDEKFDYFFNDISERSGLSADKKKAVYWPYANGDFYGLLTSLQHAECVFNSELVLLVCNKRQKRMIDWFSYGDYHIKTCELSGMENEIFQDVHRRIVFDKIKENPHPEKIVFLRGNEKENEILGIHYSRFGENLRKPNFPSFDKEEFIKKYNIVPGKTILFVPISYYVKSLPDFFWNICAQVYSYLGYKVLFNVPDEQAHRFKGENIFVSLDHAVALTELCGHVFSVRTGFLDFVSSSMAEFTVFQPKDVSRFDLEYKVQNLEGRIKTFFYDETDFSLERSFFLSDAYNYYRSAFDTRHKELSYFIEKDASGSSRELTDFESCELRRFDIYNYYHYDSPYNELFCNFPDIRYNFGLDDASKIIILKISDDIDQEKYRIDISFCKDERFMLTINDAHTHTFAYYPEEKGRYKAKVIITDKKTLYQKIYFTHDISCI